MFLQRFETEFPMFSTLLHTKPSLEIISGNGNNSTLGTVGNTFAGDIYRTEGSVSTKCDIKFPT